MLLSPFKIRELESFATRLSIEPDKLLDALISFVFIEEAKPVKQVTPEEKVKVIEEEALNKGWTYEQLWRTSPRPDLKGLINYINDSVSIGEVTEKHISLIHDKPVGIPVILNFYNINVDQPWIKKVKNEGYAIT